MNDAFTPKTKYTPFAEASALQVQVAARHAGADEVSGAMFEACEADRLSPKDRKRLVGFMEECGYIGIDTTNKDYIKPVRS